MYFYIQYGLIGEREGRIWSFLPESMYNIGKTCPFKAFGFLLVLPFLFYNSINLLVELVCITSNLTR